MKRERADRRGIYTHLDRRALGRYRTRLGDHGMLLCTFGRLAKNEKVRRVSQVHFARSHAPLLPCFD